MRVNALKTLLVVTILGLSAHALAGPGGTGGGDLCEDRIKIIRDDISSWIKAGGSTPLKLPAGVPASRYSQAMLTAIGAASIQCVSPGDRGYPVQISGVAKVCKYDHAQITCDARKFAAVSESDQYVLIHHEFAGLAGLETPRVSSSTYELSNQISGFLVDQVVKKLAVKPEASTSPVASAYTPCPRPVPTVAALFSTIKSANLAAVQASLDQVPVSMDAKNEQCQTPVQAALPTGNLALYQFLYKRAGSPDVNKTGLYKAALATGTIDAIHLVRQQGGLLTNGETELIIASASNKVAVIYQLIREMPRGASIDQGTTDYGLTALMAAARNGNLDVVHYLIQLGANVNAREFDGFNSDHSKAATGSSVLMLAASSGNLDLVNELVKVGADVNFQSGVCQDSALTTAIASHNKEVVPFLLKVGANINIMHCGTQSLMYVATQRDDYELFKILINAGAGVSQGDENGWTPLMNLAYNVASIQSLKLLIDAGASRNVVSNGSTPYSLAKERGASAEVLRLLNPNPTQTASPSTRPMLKRASSH